MLVKQIWKFLDCRMSWPLLLAQPLPHCQGCSAYSLALVSAGCRQDPYSLGRRGPQSFGMFFPTVPHVACKAGPSWVAGASSSDADLQVLTGMR